MSRKGPAPSFASKGMFDLLAGETDEVDEVEEEEEETSNVTDNLGTATDAPSAPLSKAARKRLARQAAKTSSALESPAAAALDSAKQTITAAATKGEEGQAKVNGALQKVGEEVEKAFQDPMKAAEQVRAKMNGSVGAAAQALGVNGKTHAAVTGEKGQAPANTNEGLSVPKSQAQAQSQPSGSSAAAPASTSSSASTGPSRSGARVHSQAEYHSGELRRVTSPGRAQSVFPPSSSFHPLLPADIPKPPASSSGSSGQTTSFAAGDLGEGAGHKRKSADDFTPSGSRSETFASPSKNAVKFEDGVSPGEGREGEKTMPKRKAETPAPEAGKKKGDLIQRTVWTFIMVAGFITLLCLGHPYMILLVLLCQTLVYKEVTALFELRDNGSKKAASGSGDRWSKTLNWYFFVVTNYFLYGESIIYYFKHVVFVDAVFVPFARNHRFISFMLYMVANLQRQYLRQQFALFCWVHITLLLIVVSSHFIVNNILEGHVWFFIPASLVICNDTMAYVCGKLFGRTPLIKLSPKKTVEGFVGAFILTLIFGLAWGTVFMRFPYMICPARDLGTNVLSNVVCKPNPVFVWRDYYFTGPVRQILKTVLGHEPPTVPYAPFQIHCLVMATFASLVAPFGGFFASGFKRAFNIKDFGHSIPGHGGMTDRMDCQFMMGMFSYVYYSSLIRIQNVSVGSILQTVVTSFTTEEQLELLRDLRRFLEGQGIRVK